MCIPAHKPSSSISRSKEAAYSPFAAGGEAARPGSIVPGGAQSRSSGGRILYPRTSQGIAALFSLTHLVEPIHGQALQHLGLPGGWPKYFHGLNGLRIAQFNLRSLAIPKRILQRILLLNDPLQSLGHPAHAGMHLHRSALCRPTTGRRGENTNHHPKSSTYHILEILNCEQLTIACIRHCANSPGYIKVPQSRDRFCQQ